MSLQKAIGQKKRGMRKGQTHSGSFKAGVADPRRMTKMMYDENGDAISVSQLARNDTRLALDLIRKVIPDESLRLELRLTAAKTLVNLGWAAAPRAIVSSVTHHQGNLPSTQALMHALETGEPLQLAPAEDPNTIDMDANSLVKGAANPVDIYADTDRSQ
jgi:hypothetical protein